MKNALEMNKRKRSTKMYLDKFEMLNTRSERSLWQLVFSLH